MSVRTPKKAGHLGTAAKVVLVTAAVTAAIGGLGVTAASAHSGGDHQTSARAIEVFRETVKPFDTIRIPQLSCPGGSYLENVNLSPGRIVPKGLQVVEPGGVGVTINEVTKEPVLVEGTIYSMHTGTDPDRLYSISTATNWDPFSSHELVINLSCTTNPVEGAHGDWN
jgi:hypothetical protein